MTTTTTIHPSRLLQVIKERHILISRLKKLKAKAIKENDPDVFKINRLIKHQQKNLDMLETELKNSLQDRVMLDKLHRQERIKEEEAALERLRIQIKHWVPYDTSKED